MNSTFMAARNVSKNSLNSAKNVFAPTAPNVLIGVFGSYITLGLTVVLFLMVFALIYIYFQNIGYTVNLGWDNLMNVFYNKEEVSVSVTDGSEPTGSVVLTPPESEESKRLKVELGLAPSNIDGKRDMGFPPPPASGTMPFNPDERPSGMPGATEDTYASKEKRRRRKRKSAEGQVFNVSRNLYSYEEAAPLCKAMGAELATYDQIVEAQKGGADWCNYGWTKGQMAIFPTSDETYDKLQSGPPEYRNSCGKPGVNGGFFDNPELRFGVNCFGKRPSKKDTDDLLNDTDTIVPPTAEQIEFDKKVAKFREQIDNISVLPWSRKKWSD